MGKISVVHATDKIADDLLYLNHINNGTDVGSSGLLTVLIFSTLPFSLMHGVFFFFFHCTLVLKCRCSLFLALLSNTFSPH